MSDDLLKLAERREAADGPDRWLDGDIWIALGLAPAENESGGVWGFERARYNDDGGEWRASEFNQPAPDKVRRAPAYSASLDAAMTLVPEGWRIAQLEENWRSGLWDCRVSRRPSAALIRAFDEGRVIGYDSDEAQGEAAALALTAASLKARARSAA